jgi:hypothetical protein
MDREMITDAKFTRAHNEEGDMNLNLSLRWALKPPQTGRRTFSRM